jgi:hypothetical protein
MPTKIAQNTFQGGLDKDSDPKQVQPNRYFDAENMTLSREGLQGSLTTMEGTTTIADLTAGIVADIDTVHVLGVEEVTVAVSTNGGTSFSESQAPLIFTFNETGSLFEVFCVNGSTRYKMYRRL